jgi:hypothetical protein
MNSVEFDRWAKYVRETLLPLISLSEVTCCVIPRDPSKLDIQVATELGASVLVDKPIIALIQPGTKAPEKLAAIVDRFIEFDPSNPNQSSEAISQAVKELIDDPE